MLHRGPGRLLAAFVACLSLGCSDPELEGTPVVELFSWWTRAGEVEALDALLATHERRHPHSKVINAAAQDSDTARERLRIRLESGEPPDTFQANVGQDLLRWVLYREGTDADAKLEPLDAQRLLGRPWREVFPEPVLAAAGFGGAVYAVPVNVHRTNSLFYNVQVLQDAGLEPPTTLSELYELAAALQAEGIEPFALGARGTWTIALLVFENLQGELDSAADPRMLEVLDETLRLWQYVSLDARSLEWDEAVARVHEGKAAMTVMGDWAKGTLKQLGGEPGITFGQVPFPGTDGVFVFTADTFPLPKGAPEREAALDVLATFASLEGQAAFNPLKGSIPARLDADPEDYDQLAQRAIRDFQDSRLVLALSGLAPAAFTDEVQQALGEMIDTGDPEPARFALTNRYDVLR